MLPEDDDLCIEKRIKRDAPRAFCPQSAAPRTDEPRAISWAARRGGFASGIRVALLHRCVNVVNIHSLS